MKNVLITGATGGIGSALIDSFYSNEVKVSAAEYDIVLSYFKSVFVVLICYFKFFMVAIAMVVTSSHSEQRS